MTPEKLPSRTFGEIALCLSGGGYRAATFGLGTIDMLDELGLLDDVKLLSTVSGGTFTGVMYAAWLSEKKSYNEFYGDLYEFLKVTNCVELALDNLYTTPSPSGSKDLSLIRSAAKVYNDKLFKGRKFEPLMGQVGDDKRFLELIYNSTEFRKGNSFRFRASHNPDVRSGNGSFNVANDIAAEILLADIVAASSCFPGAFEPLRFPGDFRWPEPLADVQNKLQQDISHWPSGFKTDKGCLSIPLMDGGIYDNQGITNAIMADRSTDAAKSPIFDLFLISDTSTRSDDMMPYPKPDNKLGWLTINMLFWAAVVLFIISSVSACALVYQLMTGVSTKSLTWFQIVFQFAAPFINAIALVWILGWGYEMFRKNKEIVFAGGKFQIWAWVKRLTMPDFINMLKARITSLGAMTTDVFMKRIRQLQFNVIMGDPVRKTKVAFNLIYDMNPSKDPDEPAFWKLDPALKPTEVMKGMSRDSEKVSTTLWFQGQEQDLRLLVACAQCNTVYALLRYLWRSWYIESQESGTPIPKPNDPASKWYSTYQFLIAKWELLKEDPRRYLDRERG